MANAKRRSKKNGNRAGRMCITCIVFVFAIVMSTQIIKVYQKDQEYVAKQQNNVTKSHKVLLANRKNGAFSGVVDVLSFDVAEILLETELGMLLIKGHDLHVNRLSLEKGEIDIEGRIDSLTYSEPKNVAKQSESLLGRLFK